MREMPKAGFVCTGDNALELSGAICCAGRLMRFFNEKGYATGGCYSCIAPQKQIDSLVKRVAALCDCNDVVLTVGCEGFRECDVMPETVLKIAHRTIPHFTDALCGDTYPDAEGIRRIRCFPSRAVAVMYKSCLVINLPSDTRTALGRLAPLMGDIAFVTASSSNKRAFQSTNLGELTADFYCRSSFQE